MPELIACRHTSRFCTFLAWDWMKSRRGPTASPIRVVKASSARMASWMSTWSIWRFGRVHGGLQSWFRVHLPSPLYLCTERLRRPENCRLFRVLLLLGVGVEHGAPRLDTVQRRLGDVEEAPVDESA